MITAKDFINNFVSKLNTFFPDKKFEIKLETQGNKSYLRLYENNHSIREVDLNCIPKHDVIVDRAYNALLEELVRDALPILNENTSLLPSTKVDATSSSLEVLTPPQDFGNVGVNSHKDQIILIQNTFGDDLEIDKISITRKDYTLHNPPELPLFVDSGDYLALTVRFRPLKEGKRTATIKIAGQSIKLTGYGV